MTITATEFKTNFGKYLDMVSREDIYVTKNGKTIGVFSSRNSKDFLALRGILKGFNYDKKEAREEMLDEKYGVFDWCKCYYRLFWR